MTPAQVLSVAFLASMLSLLPQAKAHAALLDPADMSQSTWPSWGLFGPTPSTRRTPPPAPSNATAIPSAPMQGQNLPDTGPVPLSAPLSDKPAGTPLPVFPNQGMPGPEAGRTDDPYLLTAPSAQPLVTTTTNRGMSSGGTGYVNKDPYLVDAPLTGPRDTAAAVQADKPGVKPTFMDRAEYWIKGRFEMPSNNPLHRPDLPRTTAITDRPGFRQ